MSSHPMIQPVAWSQHPDELINAMPESRLKIYRLIWDSALACTLKAPILQHTRATYSSGTVTVAIASVTPFDNFRGYWRFRTDVPKLNFTYGSKLANSPTLKIVKAWPVTAFQITLGQLISKMQTEGIGTPASTASLLKELLHPTTGSTAQSFLELSHDAHQHRHTVTITDNGESKLISWSDAGLIGRNRVITQNVTALANGEIRTQEGVYAIFGINDEASFNEPQLKQANGMCRYIEDVCQQWAGLGREQGLHEFAKAQHSMKPKMQLDIPAWLDPEVGLPFDHPIRLLKHQMEDELMYAHPSWTSLSSNDQASKCIEWLEDYCLVSGTTADMVRPHIFGPLASYSALKAWLVSNNSQLG